MPGGDGVVDAGRRVRDRDIIRVAVPSEYLQGRGFSVRTTNHMADLTSIVLFYPPRLREPGALVNNRKNCDALTAWLSAQLCALPRRKTTIAGMDLNDG
eukprot:8287956-Pyramimonas_sp.AAC.1